MNYRTFLTHYIANARLKIMRQLFSFGDIERSKHQTKAAKASKKIEDPTVTKYTFFPI